MPATRTESTRSAAVTGHAVGPGSLLQLLQQIAVASRQLRRVVSRFLDDLQLNDTELLLLWVCDGAGAEGIAQNRLAAAVGLSPAQVSGLVEQMGSRGLIVPCADSADRRRRLWQISSSGRQALDRVLVQLAPMASACSAEMAPIELADLVRLLASLGHIAAKEADGGSAAQPLRVFPERDAEAAAPLHESGKEQP